MTPISHRSCCRTIIKEHPEFTYNWDVVFDDRGTFIEPHTGKVVPLGTVEVRQYLGERLMSETPAQLDSESLAPTIGPINRFRTVLFVEKEGFSALLTQAQIAERFDVAIMSHQRHEQRGGADVDRSHSSVHRISAGDARFRRERVHHLRYTGQ